MGTVTSSLLLEPGQYMLSSDRDIMLLYTTDGRLLIYNAKFVQETTDYPNASEKYGNDPNYMILDRGGGVFQVYFVSLYSSSATRQIPQAPTGKGGKCVITSNGYIRLYDSKNTLYWSSPNWAVANQSGPYRQVIQKDGNLVIYDKNNKAVWATGTNLRQRNDTQRQQDNRAYYSGACTVKSC